MSFRLILLSALFYLVFISIGHGLSGFLDRKYGVLPQESTIILAGKEQSMDEFVQQYRPKYWLPTQQSSPMAERLLYEVIEQDNQYIIVYHPEWENEIAPNITQDIFYTAFRLVKYGLSLKDIEFIQLQIDKTSGLIEKVVVETNNPENTFNTNFQEHYRLVLEKTSVNTFKRILLSSEEGDVLSEDTFQMNDSEGPNLLITTWNHLVDIAKNDFKEENFEKQSFELSYLQNDVYKRLKLARRSQGDFKTKESPMNTPIVFFVGAIALFYFFVITNDYYKNKSKFPAELEKNEQ